jgi:hypothetical protein
MGIGGLNPEVEAEVSTRVYHYEDRIAELEAEATKLREIIQGGNCIRTDGLSPCERWTELEAKAADPRNSNELIGIWFRAAISSRRTRTGDRGVV